MTKMRESNMTDREILDKYINLYYSCLTEAEKKEVRQLIYKYKDAFSLRDDIGTCPNIEVENRCDRQDPILHKTFPCTRGRQKHFGQRNEETMLFRHHDRRFFCVLRSSDAHL